MILLGVSGGPDSMYLLDLLYSKRKDIVVATVNYNVRENSSYDV
ncbi:ATP-binding protein, partial [Mycoplasmopsis bovis]